MRLERAVRQRQPDRHLSPTWPRPAARSTEILNQSIDIRRTLPGRRPGPGRRLPAARRTAPPLNQIAGERGLLDQELKNLPLTQRGDAHPGQRGARNDFQAVDAAGLGGERAACSRWTAELVAIEQYFIQLAGRAEDPTRGPGAADRAAAAGDRRRRAEALEQAAQRHRRGQQRGHAWPAQPAAGERAVDRPPGRAAEARAGDPVTRARGGHAPRGRRCSSTAT